MTNPQMRDFCSSKGLISSLTLAGCLLLHGVNTASAQHHSGFSAGPIIERGSISGDLHVHVKAQPTSGDERRLVSLVFSLNSRAQRILGFSIVVGNESSGQAEITDAMFSTSPGVAAWVFRARLEGKTTNIIYTIKHRSDGEFSDV